MELRKVASTAVVLKSDASGLVEAIVNTTNVVDKQNDLMAVGSWSKVIREGQSVAICWAHEAKQIVGKVLEMRELPPGDPRVPANKSGGKGSGNAGGLWIKALFALATQAGREAFELCRGGFVKEWSVGFEVAPDGEKTDRSAYGPGSDVRTVTLVDRLYECSLVLAGASPDTATLTAKAAFARVSASRAYWDRMGNRFSPEEMDHWTNSARAIGVAAAERHLAKEKEAKIVWQFQREVAARAKAEAKAKAEEQEEAFAKQDAIHAAIYQGDRTAFAHFAPAYWRTLQRGGNIPGL
jgi:hypothetical protein